MAVPIPILAQVERTYGLEIQQLQAIGGGCIHHAHRLDTASGPFFLKYNHSGQAHNFEVESKGLQLLAETGVVELPSVIGQGVAETYAYLLMEFIESGSRGDQFWEQLGSSLAQLHQHTSKGFGLDYDNYIGALPQSNHWRSSWPEFFVEERLQPMIRMAQNKGRMPKEVRGAFDRLLLRMNALFPNEPPALIHGDLWGGNLMTGKKGQAVLIDPAVYYGHREIELAFMTLFDSQPASFYQAYQSVWSLEPGWEERFDLYNLYPLMVHVNLFGGGYLQSVKSILNRYL